jgi:BirA family biotin operon repressor/biotin-[acetyl-CoA-carboxylase] ligase
MIDHREIELLRALLPPGDEVTLTALAKQIGGDVSGLRTIIESLERDGYTFQKTREAVRLVSEPDALRPQSIRARLATRTIGREVYVFRETTSTNDLARRAGVGGAEEGVVFFAEQQTAGRGTRGRKWISAAGQGLWFSILLRSSLPTDQWPLLVQMAAVGAAEAAEKWINRPITIKPPNDLVVSGGKLAGFLLETSNASDFQVLGIGINIKSAPQIEGYPTSALETFSDSPIRLNQLAAEVLTNFETWYLSRPLDALAAAFAERGIGNDR